jgi:hypothetical protein
MNLDVIHFGILTMELKIQNEPPIQEGIMLCYSKKVP